MGEDWDWVELEENASPNGCITRFLWYKGEC